MRMKRFTATLLAVFFVFLISGCSQSGETPSSQQEGLYFSLEGLPDIGVYKNDTNRYFFEDGPHETFEPGYDYGTVVPFIYGEQSCSFAPGELKNFDEDEDFSEPININYYLYGLSTIDGRIISECGFTEMYTTEMGEKTVYIFSKATNESHICTLIPEDGSFAVSIDVDDQMGIEEYNNCPVNVIKISGVDGTVLIDENGKELINFKEAIGDWRIGNIYYTDGERFIFSAFAFDGNEYVSRAFNIDKNGKELSPFKELGGYVKYSNGMIVDEEPDDGYGVYDLDGKEIKSAAEYESVWVDESENEVWGININEGTVDKIGRGGKALEKYCFKGEIQSSDFEILNNGEETSVICQTYDGDGYEWRNLKGESFTLEEKGFSYLKKFRSGDKDYLVVSYDERDDIYDYKGNKIRSLNYVEGYFYGVYESNAKGDKITYIDPEQNIHIVSVISDEEEKVISLNIENPSENYYPHYIFDNLIKLTPEHMDETLYVLNISSGELINCGLMESFFGEKISSGGYFGFSSDNAYILMNEEAETLISVKNNSMF